MYRILFAISILAGLGFSAGDPRYPQEYFDLPVDRAIRLSGTFGELRSNHFHAGIDIKTLNGRVGEKIYAAADGYVARVKVQAGGFGNALYIAHPNGYTTVYAHLDRFIPAIADYIRSRQYALERFSVDLHPQPGQFAFKQGDHIGYLGNSGNSFGAHLHFEIRRSANQIPVNPLLFGLPIDDQVRPELQALNVYYLDEDRSTLDMKTYQPKRVAAGRYILPDTLTEAAWRVGFGLKTIDRMNGTHNANGVYSLCTTVDGVTQHSFDMNEIAYSETRYLNAHLDYAQKARGMGSFHRCYRLPGNKLGLYSEQDEGGVIALFENQVRKIVMEIRDVSGNHSTLTFYIRRADDIAEPDRPPYHYTGVHDEPLAVRTSKLTADFSKGTFYGKTYLRYQTEKPDDHGLFGDVHHFGDETIPLHKYARISIRHESLPGRLRQKAFVARITEGEVVNCGGRIDGAFLTTNVRSLGTFSIAVDTVSPKVSPVAFARNMNGRSRMQFIITDEQQVSDRASGLRYSATIDGNWALMEYDAKNDLLTHHFLDELPSGEHTLRLVVTDDRNNTTVYERTFLR